jgi:hypothetical protein
MNLKRQNPFGYFILVNPVELPKEREAADGEVAEGEVVDLLRGVVVGELGGHGIEERHVVRARKSPLPHLRRSRVPRRRRRYPLGSRHPGGGRLLRLRHPQASRRAFRR